MFQNNNSQSIRVELPRKLVNLVIKEAVWNYQELRPYDETKAVVDNVRRAFKAWKDEVETQHGVDGSAIMKYFEDVPCKHIFGFNVPSSVSLVWNQKKEFTLPVVREPKQPRIVEASQCLENGMVITTCRLEDGSSMEFKNFMDEWVVETGSLVGKTAKEADEYVTSRDVAYLHQ